MNDVSEVVGGLGEKVSTSKEGRVTTYVYKIEGEQGGSAELAYEVDLDHYDGSVKLISMKQDGLK